MSFSKPNKSDYAPSASDRTAASVAQAQFNDFKAKYEPLLLEMRDKTLADREGGVKDRARGLANADTMQALTTGLDVRDSQTPGTAEGIAGARIGQLGEATEAAVNINNNQSASVLGAARGQAASGAAGLSQIAALDTSKKLAKARQEQEVADAKFQAAVGIGSTLVGTGIRNKVGGGDFFTPNVSTEEGKTSLASSLSERFNEGMSRLGVL